jgi:hypothetical protein
MSITIISTVSPLAEASNDDAALATHWHGLCGARTYPSRRDINPADLRPYLGNFSVREVVDNLADFICRLFGSILVDCVYQDATCKSILGLASAELGQGMFKQLHETIQPGDKRMTTWRPQDIAVRQAGQCQIINKLARATAPAS